MSTASPARSRRSVHREAAADAALAADAAPRFRSGAVARMVGMPVATLRVWERRYAVCRPTATGTGQRLYTAADVRRLALLKRLVDRGHAIGSLAALSHPQLQAVASTHASTLAGAVAQPAVAGADARRAHRRRIAVVGAGLAARLERPAVLKSLGVAPEVLGPFDSVAKANAALRVGTGDDGGLLLVHLPLPDAARRRALDTARRRLPPGVSVALLYGYAPSAELEALAAAGVALLREPQGDAALGQWLRALLERDPADVAATPRDAQPIAERRWSDAALADFAGLSSTVACECPRNVAELLIQLSRFEAYSADCEIRSAADAELHHELRRVAAEARARFETALEYVALHEGLALPR